MTTDAEGELQHAFMPKLTKKVNQNTSTEEDVFIFNAHDDMAVFSPSIAQRSAILGHYVTFDSSMLAPRAFRDKPVIPEEFLANTRWSGSDNVVAITIPVCFPVYFSGKEVITGSIHERSVRENFQNFGNDAMIWANRVSSIFRVQQDGSSVLQDAEHVITAIKNADRVSELLGEYYEVNYGPINDLFPPTIFRPLYNQSDAEEGIKELKKVFGPKATSTPARGSTTTAITPTTTTVYVQKAEDEDKLHLAIMGQMTMNLMFASAIIDWDAVQENGVIGVINKPDITENMEEINNCKGESAKGRLHQMMINTAFAPKPKETRRNSTASKTALESNRSTSVNRRIQVYRANVICWKTDANPPYTQYR
jgi:hypothetical protein